MLEFECANKHQWQVDVFKYMTLRWCYYCPRLTRIERKQLRLDQRDRVRSEQQQSQQQLFESALRQMQRQQRDAGRVSRLRVDTAIASAAAEKARSYLSNKSAACSYEQALAVYRALHATKQDIVTLSFAGLSKEEATANYRRLAKALHPDKNKHPRANDAFLKVSAAYTEAMTCVYRESLA